MFVNTLKYAGAMKGIVFLLLLFLNFVKDVEIGL